MLKFMLPAVLFLGGLTSLGSAEQFGEGKGPADPIQATVPNDICHGPFHTRNEAVEYSRRFLKSTVFQAIDGSWWVIRGS